MSIVEGVPKREGEERRRQGDWGERISQTSSDAQNFKEYQGMYIKKTKRGLVWGRKETSRSGVEDWEGQ